MWVVDVESVWKVSEWKRLKLGKGGQHTSKQSYSPLDLELIVCVVAAVLRVLSGCSGEK